MLLSSFLTPSQKTILKRILYPLCRILNSKKKIDTQYMFTEFSHPKCHTYFGYYDVSPFKNEKVIYIEREVHSNVCNVVLNDIYNSSKKYIADSRAWNWQQGIRLRWMPKSEDLISFNDYINGKYVNRIINLKTSEERQLDWPLYDIDSNGKFGITLNFERLGVMRPGYGYTCAPYVADDLWEDGISIIDIEKNELVKTITYKELSESIKNINDINNFYINHLSFSPDGTKFLFFLIDEMSGFHQASLGVYNIITEELIPLETEGKASHYVWDGNDDIICTVLDKKYSCRYLRFNIKDYSKKQICMNCLRVDGHPSIYKNGMFITDSYPDTRGYQHIYLVNENEDVKNEIISIYSVPTTNLERRTDLHPRISENKLFISFDSNHDRLRKMVVLHLN